MRRAVYKSLRRSLTISDGNNSLSEELAHDSIVKTNSHIDRVGIVAWGKESCCFSGGKRTSALAVVSKNCNKRDDGEEEEAMALNEM